jgi:hypothetical protein
MAMTAPTTAAVTSGGGSARELLMVSLSRFYSTKNHMQRILPYLTCRSGVSLRLIDWFVTNYAKKNNTILMRAQQSGSMLHFNVYLSYRAQLKAYSKQQFDPFRRRDRVMFYYDRTQSVETTVGQLNFFRWMLTNDVLDYVVANADVIERDMLAGQKGGAYGSRSSSPAKGGGRDASEDAGESAAASAEPEIVEKKRVELSQCKATRNMTRVVGRRTVLFD